MHPEHEYTAFGLRVRSSIVLPFARSSSPIDEADVVVGVGATPATLPDAVRGRHGHWEATADAFLLKANRIARFLVSGGCDVIVEPLAGDVPEIAHIVAGSVFSALLHQRGASAFHASAVRTQSGAAMFLGHSGSGKSSLAAAMVDQGLQLLADDLTGIALQQDGRAVALPGAARVRLHKDSLDMLNWQLQPADSMHPLFGKYPVAIERFHAAPLELHAVYMLTQGDRPRIEIESLPPLAAFKALWQHTYRKAYVHGIGAMPAHFRILKTVSKRVHVQRVTRPARTAGEDLLQTLASRIKSASLRH